MGLSLFFYAGLSLFFLRHGTDSTEKDEEESLDLHDVVVVGAVVLMMRLCKKAKL